MRTVSIVSTTAGAGRTQSKCAAALLLLLTVGCASVSPEMPVSRPEVAVEPPAAPRVAAKPVAPAPPQSVPVAVPPASVKAPAKATPPTTRTRAPIAGTPLTLDLNALKERLKDTKAIGVFTKLSLKNKVDDLLGQFRAYYQGKTTLTMIELRRSYDLLMMKVLSLLQDEDQMLASAIVSSRETIWSLLSDQKAFATLAI
ncbi:MAG: hypothetical protein ABL993_06730 [Vicinamibacterales bacterium]